MRCFIIQPFDNGPCDKRYDDIIVPAVKAAGLEPYRTDRDPACTVPIDEIESNIQTASACLADITSGDPNIWYELGYAVALVNPTILKRAQHDVIRHLQPARPRAKSPDRRL